jgi:type VI secretion system protein ImpG
MRLRLRTSNGARSATCRWTACAAPARRRRDAGADLRKAAGQRRRRAGDAGGRPAAWHTLLPKTALRPRGFAEEDALLPSGQRSFQGYRLLQEYFAFPQRFQFVELCGLQSGLRRLRGQGSRDHHPAEPWRARSSKDARPLPFRAALHAGRQPVPAPRRPHQPVRRAARIPRAGRPHAPDGLRGVPGRSVTGYGTGPAPSRLPALLQRRAISARPRWQGQAFYQVRREPRVVSQRQRRDGPRSSYVGSETFIAIVDAANAPYSSDLRQLGLGLVHQPRPAAVDAARRRQDRLHPRRRRAGDGGALRGRPQPAASLVRRGRRGLAPA